VPDPSHAPWSASHAAQAEQLPPKKPTAQDEQVAPRQPVAQMHVPAAQDVLCGPQFFGTEQSPSPPTEKQVPAQLHAPPPPHTPPFKQSMGWLQSPSPPTPKHVPAHWQPLPALQLPPFVQSSGSPHDCPVRHDETELHWQAPSEPHE
jgi:hypothetical protein